MNTINIEKIKKKHFDITKYSYNELRKLPIVSGVIDLKFNKNIFKMLNIENDDYVPLSYLWRGGYETFSLSIWYMITRENSWFIDIGGHTGIYSIIGNLNKKKNNIISFEPYFMNYSRMVSNLRLNNIDTTNCFMCAISDKEGSDKFKIVKPKYFHSQGGFISNDGNYLIVKKRLDNFNIEKKIGGIKIDTEGHEYNVLIGSKNIIEKYLPDILIELNKTCFGQCVNFLKKYNYQLYLIDENNKTLTSINEYFNLKENKEGVNALATTNQKIERFLDI